MIEEYPTFDYAAPKPLPVFVVDDWVRHPFYGRGKVLEIRKPVNGTQYRIEFAHVTRWLYADALKKEAGK